MLELFYNPIALAHVLAPTWQLDGCELLLVVFLKCRFGRAQQVRLVDREGFDICGTCETRLGSWLDLPYH